MSLIIAHRGASGYAPENTLEAFSLAISMGADGVYAADDQAQMWLQNLPGEMVNTTGCGDAFMAALVWAYMEGKDLKESALAGLAAGSIAMESAETINPAMSATALKLRMYE